MKKSLFTVLSMAAALFLAIQVNSCCGNCCSDNYCVKTNTAAFDDAHFARLDSISKSYPTSKCLTFKYIDAKELTLIGKSNVPTGEYYHRIDTTVFPLGTSGERHQAISPAGWALVFKTNSPAIRIKVDYGWEYEALNTMPLAYHGFDLYIQQEGKWLWAASRGNYPKYSPKYVEKPFTLIDCMDNSEKVCMLYLPMYSEVKNLEIGVAEDATLEAIPSPFRHNVVFHGSSYTQGISITRAGMAYPLQFSRNTGLGVTTLGFSGNCKMQPYFADFLEKVEADAFVFDAFSNPDAKMIKERLETFIQRMSASHPGVPLIFQRTIRREWRNFDKRRDAAEQAKQDMSDLLMPELCKKYKDVYYIGTDATSSDHEASVDGTHPSDYGYTLWAQSIEKSIVKILAKYGIR